MSLVDNVCRLLDDAGVGVYSPDALLPSGVVPIAAEGMPSTGDLTIAVTPYDGPEPDTGTGWEYPRVQVRVRGKNPLQALALERECYAALQFTTGGPAPRQLPGTTPWWLQDCHALQSEPTRLGRDDAGRWEYARNYQLTGWPV